MEEDEWAVAELYLAVAFRRRMPHEAPGTHVDLHVAHDAPTVAHVVPPRVAYAASHASGGSDYFDGPALAKVTMNQIKIVS